MPQVDFLKVVPIFGDGWIVTRADGRQVGIECWRSADLAIAAAQEMIADQDRGCRVVRDGAVIRVEAID